ncbi:manganese efflux pump MntP family protein [Halalkalibacter sp. APA_J-10(15)]|uniref:manganese efflux pump MntP n=1 Tax=Halalkalibacter sp. APA_J-10(15) TaxID=2933805 RepID=UPI001FF60015|nr:manganese efflux pump MntP family protein [Halalkalibacter sp. APA_J-10(15)]MCK0470035.1 manganese efflux pump MntP family protein [Halalkalibacter sp. APA_J-10(15)]
MAEWVTLMIMACALGMDAFSVSLGMGMAGLRIMQIFRIGLVIGAFHIVMPLLGMVTGKWLSQYVGMIAHYVGGGLLLFIGVQMVISAWRQEEESLLQPVGWGLLLFAISVSLDSFSAGLSLGILGAKTLMTVGMIGLMSMVLAWLGLIVGARFQHVIGSYSELLGGCILIGFGGKLLFM